jgi:hypothetical protein
MPLQGPAPLLMDARNALRRIVWLGSGADGRRPFD